MQLRSNLEHRYGVKIPFPDGEYLWVIQGDGKFQLEPLLFDTFQQASQYALTVWGAGAIVEVYQESRHA
jgi:hypothetical protein